MDSLKLNMVAVDQIYPLLSDLVQAMMKVGAAPGHARPPGHVGRSGRPKYNGLPHVNRVARVGF